MGTSSASAERACIASRTRFSGVILPNDTKHDSFVWNAVARPDAAPRIRSSCGPGTPILTTLVITSGCDSRICSASQSLCTTTMRLVSTATRSIGHR